MATKTVKPIVLNKTILAEFAKIDKHLAAFKAAKTGADRATAKEKICDIYKKAKPILVLVASIVGKTIGAAIIAVCNGIEVYCDLSGEGLLSPADAKKLSKAIAGLCSGFAKVSPFIDMFIMIFGKNSEWSKVLSGLSAAVKSICATPGE